jgi:hypothetical protein
VQRRANTKHRDRENTTGRRRKEGEKHSEAKRIWRRGRKERKVGWEVILCSYECRSYEHVREDGALSLTNMTFCSNNATQFPTSWSDADLHLLADELGDLADG